MRTKFKKKKKHIFNKISELSRDEKRRSVVAYGSTSATLKPDGHYI